MKNPNFCPIISSIDVLTHEVYLIEDAPPIIFQYDLNSAYFLDVSGIHRWLTTYLLSYKLVTKLLKEKIIEPDLSEEEFKVQLALGTTIRRNYKINKDMLRKYVAENNSEK